mmetsp:Transcript_54528/g.144077  ORF Transcript_54528/g.144077 Transcript_54528/m.144077 type:complete len:201 (-) Transcript_54528:94-696(-)
MHSLDLGRQVVLAQKSPIGFEAQVRRGVRAGGHRPLRGAARAAHDGPHAPQAPRQLHPRQGRSALLPSAAATPPAGTSRRRGGGAARVAAEHSRLRPPAGDAVHGGQRAAHGQLVAAGDVHHAPRHQGAVRAGPGEGRRGPQLPPVHAPHRPQQQVHPTRAAQDAPPPGVRHDALRVQQQVLRGGGARRAPQRLPRHPAA